MKRFVLTASVIVLAVTYGIIGALASRASAAQLSVRLTAETPATAGQPNELHATVTDGAQPATDVSVSFYSKATFARVTGDAEIGHAVTDARGIASIAYTPSEAGEGDLSAVATAKDGTTAKAALIITIEGAPPQEYVQTAGIQIPGVNSGLIMALLGAVWGTLLFIAVTVIRIAKAGQADGAAEAGPAARGGAR
jgi:hypothetical protein